jgi:serine/threonine protein kinase
MQTGTFAAIMASIAALILILFGWCYLGYRRRKSDEMWHIDHSELNFNHPVDVIGQGAFGVVLLADYHGTKVAIKRVIPDEDIPRTGSVAFSQPSREGDSGSSPVRSDDEENIVTPSSSQDETPPGSADKSVSIDHVDWINGMIVGGKKSFFQRTFPSLFPDARTRAKLHILGNVARPAGQRRRNSLKSCLPRCDDHSKRQQEFVTEMRLLSRLRHPCITTVMGAVMSTYAPMMVMEYMENGSLYDLLRNETVYTGGEIILQILKDIAQGLRFLHASNPPILHRDLKAKNILIDSRFRAKVADFGLAIKSKNGTSGTPYWMAPEYLLQNTTYNRSCDVYSFGMTIYEIYSRKIPYEGIDPSEVLRKVCDARINYRPRVPVTCPRRMAEIMKKCWSGNSAFRPEAKDLDMHFTEMTAHDAEPLIEEGNTRLRTEVAAGDMLYQVFPKKVADQLKAGQKVEPETHDDVTVFFSDIVGFTDISRKMSAVKVCNMLDRLYLAFDNLANKHDVFKVETIGDAWVGVTNLENNQLGTHARRIAEFAIDAVAAASEVQIDEEDPLKGCIHIRVGFHSGPVVSNVIGSLNPRYGLFGDTMNTAARMESMSESGRIHCSESAARVLKEQAPDLQVRRRGKVAVKGKGNMITYWVGVSNEDVRSRADSVDIAMSGSFEGSRSASTGKNKKKKWTPLSRKKPNNAAPTTISNIRDMSESVPTNWKPPPPSAFDSSFSQ